MATAQEQTAGKDEQVSALIDTITADAQAHDWRQPPADATGTVAASEDAAPAPIAATPAATPEATADPAKATAPGAPAVEGQPAPEAPVDPLAGSQPFTFKLPDGTERTLEGVYRFPGEGVMIPEDHIASFERLAVEREQAIQYVTAAADRIQQYDKLGAWQTMGEDGQPRVLQGREGVEAMRVSHARLEATLTTLLDTLKENPASLIAVDAQNNIVLDPTAVQNLMTRAELNEMRAEQQTRALLGKVLTPTPVVPDTTAQDVKAAPALIAQALQGSNIDTKVLTPDDVQMLSSFLPRFIRPTTPAERAANPAQARIVDEQFRLMVVQHAKLRADAAARASTAERAGATNARLNSARQPAPQAPATRQPAPVSTSQTPAKPRSYGAQTDDLITSALADLGMA